MKKIQKTALGLLIVSLVGTIAFFSLLVANTQLDRGNEWFSYEWAIIANTALAMIGTVVAFVGWKQSHGRKIAIGGVCVLVVYFFIYFDSWTSESSSISTSKSTSNNSMQATPNGAPDG